jgi:uncharacterized protein (TIGR03086 family)
MSETVTDESAELPIFPTNAPAVFSDPDATRTLFAPVMAALADVVELDDDQRSLPTPCAGFDAGQLQTHVLGWLDFFATALSDPPAGSPRPDADAFVLGADTSAAEVVRDAAARIDAAIADGVAGELVVMSASRMAGTGVLGMALGEYQVHAWDLARATGRSYEPCADAVGPAHEFLSGMVAPEYRGPDSGFFDHEVPVPDGAPAFDQLLGFAGRDPSWTPPAST